VPGPLDAARLPWRAYVDPAVLAGERAGMLASAWHYVGHAARISEPGQVLPARVLDVDVVLTRDAGGEVHCLRNACRHRGARLVDAPCDRRSITCPYHAWNYALDGRLRSAPRADVPTDGSLDLPRLRVERWGPLLFARIAADGPSLEEHLAGVPDAVASAGIDVGALEWHSTSESTTACNWKVAIENYLECYHCRVAHPGLVGALDVRPGEYRLEAHGRRISPSGARIDREAGAGAGARGGAPLDTRGPIERGEYHFVFPNQIVNVAPGRPNLSLGPVVPLDASTTWRSLDYLFAPGEDAGWVEQLLAWDDEVGAEDVDLVERVQRGMASAVALADALGDDGAGATGMVLRDDEQLVAAFHDLWHSASESRQFER
jgi:choline monooxygenase